MVRNLPSLASRTAARRWPVLRPLEPAAPRLISVDRCACVVGARAPVHLHLASRRVSRAHALLVNDGGRVFVRDLASTNGVRVNGAPVREAELRRFDTLRVGPFLLSCHGNFEAAGPAAFGGDADAPEAELVSNHSTRRIGLRSRVVLIGRRRACDVVLPDRVISRAHAVIFRRDGRRFVRDLSSKYGTYLNGERVREAELHPGDEIGVGPHTLRYRVRTAAPPRPAPAAAAHDFAADVSLADLLPGLRPGRRPADADATASGSLLAADAAATSGHLATSARLAADQTQEVLQAASCASLAGSFTAPGSERPRPVAAESVAADGGLRSTDATLTASDAGAADRGEATAADVFSSTLDGAGPDGGARNAVSGAAAATSPPAHVAGAEALMLMAADVFPSSDAPSGDAAGETGPEQVLREELASACPSRPSAPEKNAGFGAAPVDEAALRRHSWQGFVAASRCA